MSPHDPQQRAAPITKIMSPVYGCRNARTDFQLEHFPIILESYPELTKKFAHVGLV